MKASYLFDFEITQTTALYGVEIIADESLPLNASDDEILEWGSNKLLNNEFEFIMEEEVMSHDDVKEVSFSD